MSVVAEITPSIRDWVESRNSCTLPKIKNKTSPVEKLTKKRTVLCKNLIVSCFLLFLSIKIHYTPITQVYN